MCLVEYFRKYGNGLKFEVITDPYPLMGVLTENRNTEAHLSQLKRWIDHLSQFKYGMSRSLGSTKAFVE